eukprot:GHVU01135761.1.p1 GENE.GHVU01135761.1~~GHVU01135761.1.p1  ORF type:complete len:201 (+),score=10.29 GHVU01135761.1:172-774(+)
MISYAVQRYNSHHVADNKSERNGHSGCPMIKMMVQYYDKYGDKRLPAATSDPGRTGPSHLLGVPEAGRWWGNPWANMCLAQAVNISTTTRFSSRSQRRAPSLRHNRRGARELRGREPPPRLPRDRDREGACWGTFSPPRRSNDNGRTAKEHERRVPTDASRHTCMNDHTRRFIRAYKKLKNSHKALKQIRIKLFPTINSV